MPTGCFPALAENRDFLKRPLGILKKFDINLRTIHFMINSGNGTLLGPLRQEPATKQYAYLSQLPNPVAVLKGAGYVIELANTPMLELWGKTSEAVLHRPFFEVFPGQRHDKLAATFQQVLQRGTEVICPEVPQSFWRNDKAVTEIHKVILAPLAHHNGHIEGLLVVHHDITDSVKDRKNLEEKEAFIRTVLESSPDCVKVLNEAGQLSYMNHEGLCIMEIADFCMVQDRYWWELWPAESQEVVRASVLQALGGATARFQAFCPTAKGTPKWWDVVVSPISGADGKVSQLISVSRDITGQKNAAEAIVVRNRHLDLLARTAQALIVSDKEESALLQGIFDDVCHTLGIELFYNFLAEPDMCALRLNTWGGLTPAEARFFSVIQFGEYLCGRVAMHRKCIIAENITQVAYEGADALRTAGVQAYAGFPLIAKNQLIGTIAFATRLRTHFREGEIQLIQAICDQIAATVERSRLNKELLQSESRFRNIFETVPVAVLEEDYTQAIQELKALQAIHGPNLESYLRENETELTRLFLLVRVKSANKASVSMFEAGGKEKLLQGMHAVLTPEALPVFLDKLLAILSREKGFEGEYVLQTLQGRKLHCLVSITIPEDISSVLVSRFDITQRKEDEESLRETVKEVSDYKYALDQSSIVAVTNQKGVIQYVNDKFCEISGYTREELVGQDHRILNSGYHTKEFIRNLWTTIAGGNIWMGELKNRAKDGSYYWVDTTIVPFLNEQGKPYQYVAIRTDITARKNAVERIAESELRYRNLAEKLEFLVEERTRELEWSNKELQRSNEDLQQFAHVASHDLKEPVRKVLTFNGRLAHEFGAHMPDKARQYLSRIEVSAKRSYDMIEGLLHYAKVNSTTKVPEQLNLNEVLQHIETDLEVVIQEKSAVIRYDRLPTIEGAPELICQLFYNLIANALKFSRPGVPPQISIWAEQGCEGAAAENIAHAGAKWLRIYVQDNGVGFDQQHAEKIFQTYARLHSKDQFEGSGLGLALCRKIVERHEGTIAAYGIKDEGARFVITFPQTTGRCVEETGN